jgi:hypothetical protein
MVGFGICGRGILFFFALFGEGPPRRRDVELTGSPPRSSSSWTQLLDLLPTDRRRGYSFVIDSAPAVFMLFSSEEGASRAERRSCQLEGIKKIFLQPFGQKNFSNNHERTTISIYS